MARKSREIVNGTLIALQASGVGEPDSGGGQVLTVDMTVGASFHSCQANKVDPSTID